MKLLLLLAATLSLLVAAPAFADDIPSTLRLDTSGALPPGLTLEAVVGAPGLKANPGALTTKVERVMYWNEGNGANLAVFVIVDTRSRRDGEEFLARGLYVTTFSERDGVYTKQQAIRELVQPCQFDLAGRFLPRSITLTNLDNDDRGELTFGYVVGCRSDVSPDTMKILMLERDAKHALRGQTLVGDPEVPEGGTFRPDFKGAPPAFLEHAKKVWAANLK